MTPAEREAQVESRSAILRSRMTPLERAKAANHPSTYNRSDAAGDSDHCHDCGGTYGRTLWTAPDEGRGPNSLTRADTGILCPDCFDNRAKAIGLTLRWVPPSTYNRSDAAGPPPATASAGSAAAAADPTTFDDFHATVTSINVAADRLRALKGRRDG